MLTADSVEAADLTRVLETRRQELDRALDELAIRPEALARAADLLVETLHAGCKVLVAGNGGSAAMAQHFAAELVGRFKRDRMPYAALALSTDTSILTAVANDYSYADVFARQVQGLGQPGDLLILLSTSGESENLVRAARAARERGIRIISMVGSKPCRLASLADVAIQIALADSALVQELHLAAVHILCEIVETALEEPTFSPEPILGPKVGVGGQP